MNTTSLCLISLIGVSTLIAGCATPAVTPPAAPAIVSQLSPSTAVKTDAVASMGLSRPLTSEDKRGRRRAMDQALREKYERDSLYAN